MLFTCMQGLRLFNLDIIREYGTRDHYYVIDINYFPGEWFTIYLHEIDFASIKFVNDGLKLLLWL